MDSLTQFVLGSTISVLCLGKTLGPRNAALLGGVPGTTPDLDVFLSFDTTIDAFVMHRGCPEAPSPRRSTLLQSAGGAGRTLWCRRTDRPEYGVW